MAFALQFESVTKIYRRLRGPAVTALDNFSLSVEPGEIFGFLGPNGAGKTTAIHLAMGFMRPTHGTGTMLGARFGTARVRRRVGFLAENVALYHRSALQLIRFYGALNGLNGSHLGSRAWEMLKLVGLEGEAHRNAGKFSRGMLQRVGLAQALVNDPEMVVLDEPTSALDPLARVAVRELLLDLRRRGRTVFLSSHLLSEVELICDRVAVVREGHVVRSGKTSELLESQSHSELVAHGITAEQFNGKNAEGDVYIIVPTSELRQCIERIWASGGEVLRVNPVRRSLEELFVELVDRNGGTR